MTRIRVGLIGLGEVAQLIHLPVLHRLHDLYEVTALCDLSPSVLARVATRWKVARQHGSIGGLVDDDNVDVVFVLSPDQHHFEHAGSGRYTPASTSSSRNRRASCAPTSNNLN